MKACPGQFALARFALLKRFQAIPSSPVRSRSLQHNKSKMYIVPVSLCIMILLAIVYFSYRQTIAAYPGGGGSYTVATENLGMYPGLLVAAAQGLAAHVQS